MSKSRNINILFSAILLLMLVACSTTKESKVVGVSKNNNFIAQITFDNKIYSLEGNLTPEEKIQQKVGEVENIVEKLTGNGQGKIISSNINLKPGSEIYSIKDADKDSVIAVKVSNNYYTAIFLKALTNRF